MRERLPAKRQAADDFDPLKFMNLLKKLPIGGLAFFIAGIAAVNAGLVSIQNSDLRTSEGTLAVTDSAGALIPPGTGYVAAGTFTLSDADIASAGAASNWSALLNDFTQFGVASGVADFAGIISYDVSAPLADGDAFVGKPLFVIIGNTATVASDPATASSWLVFKSSTSFAADDPEFQVNAGLNTATADQVIVGTIGGPVNIAALGADTRASLQLQGNPLHKLSVESAVFAESDSAVEVGIFNDTDSTIDASVFYTPTNGTALGGLDYTASAGTVTIPAGQQSATITIPILNDNIDELNESFTVRLSNPVRKRDSTVTIGDDDVSVVMETSEIIALVSAVFAALAVIASIVTGRNARVEATKATNKAQSAQNLANKLSQDAADKANQISDMSARLQALE
ncbi:MAG: hypothetical protein ACI9R3_005596 [Verrucomicrobiales bacterium]|jgi:hypothetical protein